MVEERMFTILSKMVVQAFWVEHSQNMNLRLIFFLLLFFIFYFLFFILFFLKEVEKQVTGWQNIVFFLWNSYSRNFGNFSRKDPRVVDFDLSVKPRTAYLDRLHQRCFHGVQIIFDYEGPPQQWLLIHLFSCNFKIS